MFIFAWFAALLPGAVYALPALLLYVLFGYRARRVEDAIFWELKPDSWFLRTLYRHWGGTTFGLVVMTRPDPSVTTVHHELEHVEQFICHALAGLLLGSLISVTAGPWWGLTVWAVLPGLTYIAAGLVSVFFGGRFYRDNYLERAAYDSAARARDSEAEAQAKST